MRYNIDTRDWQTLKRGKKGYNRSENRYMDGRQRGEVLILSTFVNRAEVSAWKKGPCGKAKG